MIIFRAQGGLGNQLFQYATARRLAWLHSCQLVIDDSWFNRSHSNETARQLELTRFRLNFRFPSRLEQIAWLPMRSRGMGFAKILLPVHLVRENGFGMNSQVLNAPRNSYLDGFWQSEKYFKDIRQELLSEIIPKESASRLDAPVIGSMRKTNSVSIHIRRGDYVTLPSAAAYHGTCEIDYYHRAIEYLGKHVTDPFLFVFSDDHQWVKANLRFPFKTHHVDHNPTDLAFQDLRLMSHCKHHIIANSSFSWWGAWLAESLGQIVIAPKQWFKSGRPTPDLLPAEWIKI